MSQSVAQLRELADFRVELVRSNEELVPVDARASVRIEHLRDLVEREPGDATEADQGESLQHRGLEQSPETAPADRPDQALVLVETQGGRGHAGGPRDLGDVQRARGT